MGLKYCTPPGHNTGVATPHLAGALLSQRMSTTIPNVLYISTFLPLLSQGQRIDDFATLWADTHQAEDEGDLQLAETRKREALSGYETLLSPTNDDSLKIGYQLANVCAMQERILQADEILEQISKNVAVRWSLSHPRSEHHHRKICDLFKTWPREKDAQHLMRRLNETTMQLSGTGVSPLIEYKKKLYS